MERGKIAAISAMHFLVDIYSGFFGIYLVIAGLDPVIAASISALASFVGNGLQPFLGYFADRVRGKLPVFAGMLMGSICMSCIGLTQNYVLLFVLMLFGKIGISLFHPAGANISGAAGRSRREFGFSIFTTVGTFGFALSHPSFSVVTGALGTHNSYLLALPCIVFAFAYLFLGEMEIQGHKVHVSFHELRRIVLRNLGQLTVLFLVMILRAAFVIGIGFFVAKLFAQWGFDRMLYSTASTVFSFSGASGVLLVGALAHRVNGKTVMLISLTGFIPFYAAFLYFGLAGNVLLTFLFLGITGFIVFSGQASNVVMGQRIVPEMISTVSGFLMGFAWAVANFSGPLVAALEDAIPRLPGLMSGFAVLVLLPLLAALLAVFLKEPSRQQPVSSCS